jgi:hypothetical protein
MSLVDRGFHEFDLYTLVYKSSKLEMKWRATYTQSLLVFIT